MSAIRFADSLMGYGASSWGCARSSLHPRLYAVVRYADYPIASKTVFFQLRQLLGVRAWTRSQGILLTSQRDICSKRTTFSKLV